MDERTNRGGIIEPSSETFRSKKYMQIDYFFVITPKASFLVYLWALQIQRYFFLETGLLQFP